MTRVLVTGSAGFIGGYVVQELLACGYEVVGLDDFSKYGRVTRDVDSDPRYRLIKGDAGDADVVSDALTGCEHFIAGAALIGGIAYFHANPYDILATNNRLTGAACDAAIRALREGTLQKVTYVSSSMVFESVSSWPSCEGDERLTPPPKSSYGFQKLGVEYYARAAWDQYRLPYTIVRPFNCVGVGEARAVRDAQIFSGNLRLTMSHVVPDLIQKILKGQDPVRILGNGSQLRHYTYGGDLARGIVTAMGHPAAENEDFNLSTDESTTVIALAERIWQKIKGPDLPFRYIQDPAYEHDVQVRSPSVEKAREILGFTAVTTLDEMLDEVIPWVKDAIAIGRI
jgi:nucleoside-diphosphate-sugar epimerase